MRSGSQVTAADGNLDFTIIRRNGRVKLQLSGPTSVATQVAYAAGDEVFNIRFRPGIYLTGRKPREMLDAHLQFAAKNRRTFWLGSIPFSVPTFETAEEFVSELLRLRFLAHDPLVATVLAGGETSGSERTIQHRFLHSVGLSYKFLAQVHRAERAVSLLQQGKNVMDVVCELGYNDQSHMTHSLRRLTGLTPVQHGLRRQDW